MKQQRDRDREEKQKCDGERAILVYLYLASYGS